MTVERSRREKAGASFLMGVLSVTALTVSLVSAGGCTRKGADAPTAGASAPAATPAYTVTIGGVGLLVEVAATAEAHERGLSGRSEVPAGSGMLFVFPAEDIRSFWMKDTPAPLSVAFLDQHGRITQIEDMAPLSEDAHKSWQPARYVIEVPQGWFTEMGIKVGDRAVFGETLRRRLQEHPGER
jgi:hypothetical protein